MWPIIFYAVFILIPCLSAHGSTHIRELVVDGVDFVYSYNFPDPIESSYEQTTSNLDWKVTSKNNQSLLVAFDTLDTAPSDFPVTLCDEVNYFKCVNQTEWDKCDCISVQDVTQFPDWTPSKGPLYFFFRPVIPEGAKSAVRNGFRAVVQEHVDRDHFFQCNATFDITDRPNPLWFFSQGFPFDSKAKTECEMTIKSADGIRIRFPFATFAEHTIFILDGLDVNNQPISVDWREIFMEDSNNIGTVHFRDHVKIHYKFDLKEFDGSSFAMTAEPFDVTPGICDVYWPGNYHNVEFDIATNGFEFNENYITNINCSYNLDGVTPNHQLMLSLKDFNMESGADYLSAVDFGMEKITGYRQYLYLPSVVNISSTSLVVKSDGLGTRSGFTGHMYILDCTCGDGVFNLAVGDSFQFKVPLNNGVEFADYLTYCRGITCEWTFLGKDPTAEVTFGLTNYDISLSDRITLEVNSDFPRTIQMDDTLTYFNVQQLKVSFVSVIGIDGQAIEKGFQFSVSAAFPRPIDVDLSNSSIFLVNGKIEQMNEWHFTSQKGRMAVIIAKPENAQLLMENIFVFDGGFNGTRIPNTNQPMVAQGREISLRLLSNDDNDEMEIFISDSFVDNNGAVCGGVSAGGTANFSAIPGCLSVFYGTGAVLSVSSPVPIPAYRGVSVLVDDLIPLSDKTALSLVTSTTDFAVTFKAPDNIQSGASYNVVGFTEYVEVVDDKTTLIVSPDYLYPGCGGECGLQSYLHYAGDKSDQIHFELIQTLGQGELTIDERTYNDWDGLVNVTVGTKAYFNYESTENALSRLVAKTAHTTHDFLERCILLFIVEHLFT